MDNINLKDKLREVRSSLLKDEIEILGYFSGFARGNYTKESDIDILYKIVDIDKYLKKHSGWDSVNFLVETKKSISLALGKDIDFVDKDSLNCI